MTEATYTNKAIGNSTLFLGGGSRPATLRDLMKVKTPQPTKSWTPVPHVTVIEEVEDTLGRAGLAVKESAYGLYRDGARFFGLLGLDIKGGDGDYQLVVGLRNSHDKSFPVGMVVGSRVFVCDNLAFSSEIQVTRRHTRRVLDDLPRLIATAVGQIGESAERQERRFAHYKNTVIGEAAAHDVLVQALDVEAIPCTMLPKVLKEWREPVHEEFKPRTAWSLFNSFTEVYKQASAAVLPRRSLALQGLLDAHTRFALEGVAA